MQETEFIDQNKEKWKEFEDVLGSRNRDPDRLTNLFIETTDDLSYSQTYYGNRSIRVYLNRVAQQVYQAIYRNKSKTRNRWSAFWFRELPEALWVGRKAMFAALMVFLGGLAIGIVSSVHYPEFARVILGDSYVAMTEANIKSGDPMAVYADADPVDMFFNIALNNIRVGFMAFLLGLTFAIGTYYILLFNGVMVGAFIYFFIERGLFKESFLAIMLHGTLELSMIVMSGAAGLVLARGLLIPGTYTRTQALVISARAGIKIMLAVTLFLIYAAIIESFATRFTTLPGVPNGQLILDYLRALVILLSASIVVGYFVIYPARLHRRGALSHTEAEELPPAPPPAIPIDTIKPAGRMFTESFLILGRHARLIAIHSAWLAVVFTACYIALTKGKIKVLFENMDVNHSYNPLHWFWVWDNFRFHLNFERFPLAFILCVVLFAIWLQLISRIFLRAVNRPSVRMGFASFAGALLISLLTGLPLLLDQGWTFLIQLFWFPFWMFVWMAGIIDGRTFPFSISRALWLLRGAFWKNTATIWLLLSMQWLMLLVLYSEFAWIPLQFIQTNLSRFSWLSSNLPYVLYTFLIAFVPLFIFSLSMITAGLQVFSQREVNEATSLKSAITSIGFKRRAYGLEKE